jgi:hypothetical protein
LYPYNFCNGHLKKVLKQALYIASSINANGRIF